MSLYSFVATKGRDIMTVKPESMGSLKQLHNSYFQFGWNVSEAVNTVTGIVVLTERKQPKSN